MMAAASPHARANAHSRIPPLSTPTRSKYNTSPKFRIHKLENCNLIFEYLRKKELQLTNIGSTDIVDSNEKLILGLMWTIILRFAIAEDGKQGACMHACIVAVGRFGPHEPPS